MKSVPHVRLAPCALLLAALAASPAYLHAQTWDGGGANDAWSTADNWASNTVPASNGTTDVTFAGNTRLTPSLTGNRTQRFIIFNDTAGAFNLGGWSTLTLSGGITNNSASTQTVGTQLSFSDHQTWTAASGAILVNGYVSGNGKNLSLNGSHVITFNDDINGAGAITVNGSGARTFNDYISGTSLSITGSGTTTLNGSGNNFSTISVSGVGNTIFNTTINNSAYTQTGGNVTFSGSGNNNFSSFDVTGGTLHLNKSGGAMAVNAGQMNVTNAVVSFGASNQFNNTWTDITLGDGATLYLGNTTQSIDNLVITGDAIIDFGSGGSTFDIDSISFGSGSSLTVVNWNNAVDHFYADLAPGSSLPQVIYLNPDGSSSSGTWGSGAITPGAPVPEPAAFGLVALGGLISSVLLRRRARVCSTAS